MAFNLEIEDGKYTFVNDNGIVKILRYGKEWQDETGNKSLLCLLQKVEGLELEIKKCYRDIEELQQDKVDLEQLAFDLGKEKEMFRNRNEEILIESGKRWTKLIKIKQILEES